MLGGTKYISASGRYGTAVILKRRSCNSSRGEFVTEMQPRKYKLATLSVIYDLNRIDLSIKIIIIINYPNNSSK